MDDIDQLLSQLTVDIARLPISDVEKADTYAQISAGLHHLVWPIIMSYIPEYLLKEAMTHPDKITIDEYIELIESSLQNPATPKEIHGEVKGALEEVEALVTARLEPKTKI